MPASALDRTLDELFQASLGLPGNRVTLQFIRLKRENGSIPLDDNTEYWGRTPRELEELTPDQDRDALRDVDELIDNYS
jgi:hypothetical protein